MEISRIYREILSEEEARRQGKVVLRPDTYKGNLPASAMYPRLGYRCAGATEFFLSGLYPRSAQLL